MAKAAANRMRKVGVTHHPLEEEKNGQRRVQSKRQALESAKQKRTAGRMAASPLSEKEKREIDRKGAKTGKGHVRGKGARLGALGIENDLTVWSLGGFFRAGVVNDQASDGYGTPSMMDHESDDRPVARVA